MGKSLVKISPFTLLLEVTQWYKVGAKRCNFEGVSGHICCDLNSNTLLISPKMQSWKQSFAYISWTKCWPGRRTVTPLSFCHQNDLSTWPWVLAFCSVLHKKKVCLKVLPFVYKELCLPLLNWQRTKSIEDILFLTVLSPRQGMRNKTKPVTQQFLTAPQTLHPPGITQLFPHNTN